MAIDNNFSKLTANIADHISTLMPKMLDYRATKVKSIETEYNRQSIAYGNPLVDVSIKRNGAATYKTLRQPVS